MSPKIVGEKSAPEMSGYYDLFVIPQIKPHRRNLGLNRSKFVKNRIESLGYIVWTEEITQDEYNIRNQQRLDLKAKARSTSQNASTQLIQICRDLNEYEQLTGEEKFTEEKEQLRAIRKSIETKLLG